MEPALEKSDTDETELFSRDATSGVPFAAVPRPDELSPRLSPSMLDLDGTVSVLAAPALRSRWFVAGGVAIVALSLVSVIALRVPPAPPAAAPPHAHRVVGAHEAVIVPALTAPGKDVVDSADHVTAASLATSAPVARAAQLGLLIVPPSTRGILVDGTPHRVEHASVSLPCGTHLVKAPSQPARNVVIACGATTTL